VGSSGGVRGKGRVWCRGQKSVFLRLPPLSIDVELPASHIAWSFRLRPSRHAASVPAIPPAEMPARFSPFIHCAFAAFRVEGLDIISARVLIFSLLSSYIDISSRPSSSSLQFCTFLLLRFSLILSHAIIFLPPQTSAFTFVISPH